MMGSLFAGVDESPGRDDFVPGAELQGVSRDGVASAMAQGSGERYFQGKDDMATEGSRTSITAREGSGGNRLAKFVPEGIEGRVPHRGPLEAMVYQLVGGLRSEWGISGAGRSRSCRRMRGSFGSPGRGCARAMCMMW